MFLVCLVLNEVFLIVCCNKLNQQKGHKSFNKVEYCQRSWLLEARFTVAPFKRKSIVIAPFMFQKIVSITFSTGCYNQNCFFCRESVYFHFMDCLFNSGLSKQTRVLIHLERFIFIDTYFSVLITHSFVNFTWFVFLSHQKVHDRPLFKPGALWFATILNSLKTNLFVRLKWFLL